MEERYAEKPYTTESETLLKQLSDANRKIEKLEKIVGALAVTNFLTQHEDGDEEVRDQSVEKVNEYAYQFKQGWKVEKQIAELESKKWELDQEIQNLKWGNMNKLNTAGLSRMTISANGALGIGNIAPALQIGNTAIDEKDLKALKALSGGTV